MMAEKQVGEIYYYLRNELTNKSYINESVTVTVNAPEVKPDPEPTQDPTPTQDPEPTPTPTPK